MRLPENYILIEKEVKHARLRVSENGQIRVIVPSTFSEEDLQALLKKKKRWIEQNLKFFGEMSKIVLQRNQILLYGNRYNYFYDPICKHKVVVDHEHKTIRAKK